MGERHELRVSDRDRQTAADKLRAAHDEGRLDFAEYDDRLARAYSSVTYGDLDLLFIDLPAAGGLEVAHLTPGMSRAAPPTPARRRPRTVAAEPSVIAAMPTALKVLWIIWASVVAINLTVWLLVSLGSGGPEYFWPMWLAVPGSVLFAVTAGVSTLHRDRRPSPPPIEPPEK
jgi:hypothetical protein